MEIFDKSGANARDQQRPSRREFLRLAGCAASGLAFWQLVPEAWAECAIQNAPLAQVGEIVSSGGFLHGIIDTKVVKRSITYFTNPVNNPPGLGNIFACETDHMLRSYQGYRGFDLSPANTVIKNMAMAGPGPTLRVGVGETIEIIFLNRIDPAMLPATAVTSIRGQCDTSTQSSSGQQVYPGPDATHFPNCFHASNTTNIHWHGTHTSPSNFGDNVFLGILPNSELDTSTEIGKFREAFAAWNNGADPTAQLIAATQASLNKMYQAALAGRNTTLADQLKAAIDANQKNMAAGEFPQFWLGAFPYRVELPRWSGDLTKFPRMGQAPGTHWYHCHQHGSTSLQILNGMAGAVIITDHSSGGYDRILSRLGYKEQVMVLQLYSEQPNRVNTGPSASQVAVNGQIVPTVTMKRGEVQWWRLIDAAVRAHGIEHFFFVDDRQFQRWIAKNITLGGDQPEVEFDKQLIPTLNQCAQDGVQFAWENFEKSQGALSFRMAPGNRADFLVQAPLRAGTSWLVFRPPAGPPPKGPRPILPQAAAVLKVVVTNELSDQQLPTEARYPKFPGFLADITDEEIHGNKQQVDFSMTGAVADPPFFFIDGKQFKENVIDHVMLKDTAQEWTLTNTSLQNISHPFHIHINPFQVVEVYDPNTMPPPAGQMPDPVRDAKKLPQPWVWWDVISIPSGREITQDGKSVIVPGHIKMRSRFDDFYGKFVLHCHILGHEDRGMMEVVEVVNNTTVVTHH